MTTDIKIAKIRIDGNTQPRTKINLDVVSEYTTAFEMNESLPPVDVFHDGKEYWLADGFHRFHGASKAGRKEITCNVHKGTQREAILFSVGANASHGLRRTNEDKRASVLTLLNDEEWGKWSAREIANACAVSHQLVNDIRGNVSGNIATEKPKKVKYTTKHGTESTQSVTKKTKATTAEKPAENTETGNPASVNEPPPTATPVTEPAKPSEYPEGFDPTEFDPEMNPALDRKSVAKLDREQQLIEQPKMIEAFCRSVHKFFNDNLPSDPLLDEGSVNIAQQQLKSALNTLRQRKAYGACPKCPEKIHAKCGFCKGVGYVNKTTFESAGGVK